MRGASERAWFRQNPPLPEVRWSLRNNVNFQQSGVLFALHDMAENRERFLERFWTMGKRADRQGGERRSGRVGARRGTEAPGPAPRSARPAAAPRHRDPRRRRSVLDADELAAAETGRQDDAKAARQEAEEAEPVKFAKGSYIIRMDQPYSRLADTLLDVQYVRGEEKVYDDTGWTLGYLKNVDVKRVVNPDVLKVKMTRVEHAARRSARSRRTTPRPRTRGSASPIPRRRQPRIALMHTWISHAGRRLVAARARVDGRAVRLHLHAGRRARCRTCARSTT